MEPETGGPVEGWICHSRLHDALAASRFGRRLTLLERVTSTSDVARRLGREGHGDGAVVLARAQSAGRGRRGRVWESPAEGGLYASVLLRPPRIDASYAVGVQLAAGVALAETLAPLLPRRPELLWPNDCLCDGGKIAGVLVESESAGGDLDFLVCGIGVNVNQSRADFSAPLACVATSVRILRGAPAELTEVATALLLSLDRWEDVVRRGGPEAVVTPWMEWAPSARGAEVEVETSAGMVRGISAGLSAQGGLRVQTGADMREIVVGELIRVRRKT